MNNMKTIITNNAEEIINITIMLLHYVTDRITANPLPVNELLERMLKILLCLHHDTSSS